MLAWLNAPTFLQMPHNYVDWPVPLSTTPTHQSIYRYQAFAKELRSVQGYAAPLTGDMNDPNGKMGLAPSE